MPEWFEDRRRSPRVTVAAGHEFVISMWSTVQLLDISMSGVLLSAAAAVEVGRRARLRAMLGGERLDAQVEVRREELKGKPAQQYGAVRLGATFVALDEEGRRSLERFLKKEVS